MEYKKLLNCLRPEDCNTSKQEPFPIYRDRVKQLLPNWPDCPLEQWLHRHYSDVTDVYAWLRFDKMQFNLVYFQNAEIYDKVRTFPYKLKYLDSMQTYYFSNNKLWFKPYIEEYLMNNGTWPIPIIILKNDKGIVDSRGLIYGQPYHLMEGHRRLGFFRNIYRNEISRLNDKHKVWVVNIE